MRRLLTFLLVLVALCMPPSAFSEKPLDIQSLSGLNSVDVLIEDINSNSKIDALSREQLKTEVELRLRRAGIKLLGDMPTDPPIDFKNAPQDAAGLEKFSRETLPIVQEWSNSRRQTATVYVKVEVLASEFGAYVYTVAVQVSQDAHLDRRKDVLASAKTWSQGVLGVVDRRIDIGLTIRRQILPDLLDRFINDYLSVNPRSSAGR